MLKLFTSKTNMLGLILAQWPSLLQLRSLIFVPQANKVPPKSEFRYLHTMNATSTENQGTVSLACSDEEDLKNEPAETIPNSFIRHFERRAVSLSNTVEQIRPVNGLTRLVRLVRPVQVVKQSFTGCTGRGSMVTCISLVTLHFNLDGTTRTTRTTRTGRETMVYESYSW